MVARLAYMAQPMIEPNALHDWLLDAKAGETIPYFIGHLARAVQFDENLDLVAKIARKAERDGKAYLTQRRHDADAFVYSITKARAP